MQISAMLYAFPGVGTYLMLHSVVTGSDLVGGTCLSKGERLLGAAFMVAGGLGSSLGAVNPEINLLPRRLIKGGTYRLISNETGAVMRTGRSMDLARRQGQHARHEVLGEFRFMIDKRTNNYFAQRGREYIIWSEQNAQYDIIRPISDINPLKPLYLYFGGLLK